MTKTKIIHPNYGIVRAGVINAFRFLRNRGIVARTNYMCCTTCASFGLAQIALEKGKKGFAYYHGQDIEGFKEDGCVYIGFGGTKDWYDDELMNRDREKPFSFPERGLTDNEAGELVARVLREQSDLVISWRDPERKIRVSGRRRR